MSTVLSSGLRVRSSAVLTDSSTASFFLSSLRTVSVLMRSTRAVSRTPLALRLMSMICCFTSGKRCVLAQVALCAAVRFPAFDDLFTVAVGTLDRNEGHGLLLTWQTLSR